METYNSENKIKKEDGGFQTFIRRVCMHVFLLIEYTRVSRNGSRPSKAVRCCPGHDLSAQYHIFNTAGSQTSRLNTALNVDVCLYC